MIDLEKIIKYQSEIKRFIEILEQYSDSVDFWILRGCVGAEDSAVSATIWKGEINGRL